MGMLSAIGILLVVVLGFLWIILGVLSRRLDEVESVVWALHRTQHGQKGCEEWKCVEYAKMLSKTKGV